jgi:hypothetical protein
MEKYRFPVIACAGNGFSGKDSTYLALKNILQPLGIQVVRFALADELKLLCRDFIYDRFGISVFTTDKKDKDLIRPLLVEIGRIKREKTMGQFWTGLLTPKILNSLDEGELCVISDLRYVDERFPNDEYNWLKNTFNGILIYVTRHDSDGKIIPPANLDEKINNEKLKLLSDYQLTWPTLKTQELRNDYAAEQLKSLIDKIKSP